MAVLYEPLWSGPAVCCSPHHVYVVADLSSYIHIHTWDGQHTQRLSLDVDVGDRIRAISYSASDNTLLVTVGRRGGSQVHSIRTLMVS